MELSFHPLTLEAIDSAAVESLCLFLASDERPLRGLAGLTDWRLSGRLSRLLRAGLLSGDAGEAVHTPPGARMGFQKLFLFGVGPSEQSEESLVARLTQALRTLAQAGVREAAMELPSRLAPEAGIRTLVAELQGPGRAVVFAAEPQKLAAALAQVSGQPYVERQAVKVPAAAAPPAAKPALPRNPPPPPSLPKATPLPFVPQPEPGPKPTPGQTQRYVPPPPKPHVFQKGKKKP